MKKLLKFTILFAIILFNSLIVFCQQDENKLIIYEADNYESLLGYPCMHNDYFIRINYKSKMESINPIYVELFRKLIVNIDKKEIYKDYDGNIEYFPTNVIIDIHIIKGNWIGIESISIAHDGTMKIGYFVYPPNKDLIDALCKLLPYLSFSKNIDYDNQ